MAGVAIPSPRNRQRAKRRNGSIPTSYAYSMAGRRPPVITQVAQPAGVAFAAPRRLDDSCRVGFPRAVRGAVHIEGPAYFVGYAGCY
jgi:hypothetical protein